jgi:hypothetical protein
MAKKINWQKFPQGPFEYHILLDHLADYEFPNDRIRRMIHEGDLIRILKGLYILGSEHRKGPMYLEQLANMIYGPSCLSAEYVLSRAGWIPEAVYTVTSVTTRRSKSYKTGVGEFHYAHVPEKLYAIGIESVAVGEKIYALMANPAKALCDLIFLRRGLNNLSAKEMLIFLNEDLRIDFGQLEPGHFSIFEACAQQPHKQKIFQLLLKVLEKML